MVHYRFLRTNVPIDLDRLFGLMRWLVLISVFIINFMILFDSFVESCEECEEALAADPDSKCICDTMTTDTKLSMIFFWRRGG